MREYDDEAREEFGVPLGSSLNIVVGRHNGWYATLSTSEDLKYYMTPPNWFHRQMQRLILGIVWHKPEIGEGW